MTWLEKMDAVLECIFSLKANNPTFEDLQSWLRANYPEVDKGEIQDITLYLWKEGMMYLEFGGDRNHIYYEHDLSRYLISCKGKMLWEDNGGFGEVSRIEQENQTIEETRNANAIFYQRWIWVATSIMAIYYLLEMLKYFHVLPQNLFGVAH